MRKILFIIICLLTVVSCTERRQPLVYHPKLVQIDSILQHDSLKWKNLNRGERQPTVYLYTDTFDRGEEMVDGTYHYDEKIGKCIIQREPLHPMDDAFGERAPKTKTSSLLFLLKHFPQDSLLTEADSMYYALLKAEVLAKDYLARYNYWASDVQEYMGGDSLLQRMVDYYDRLGDKPMQARAHSLLAFSRRGVQGSRAEEVREHLTALHYINEVGNEELEAFIYRFLGRAYFYSQVYQKSDSIYRLAEQLAIEQKDTLLWMESIRFRLMSEKEMGQRGVWLWKNPKSEERYLRSEERIRQGLDLAHAFGAKEYEAEFAILLGEEYVRRGNLDKHYAEKALHYGKMADRLLAELETGNLGVPRLMAKAYLTLGHVDSAAIYLDQMYGNEWRKRGPNLLWMDVVHDPGNREKVASAEAELQKKWQKERYEGFLLRNKYLLAGMVLAGVLLVLLLQGYHRRRYRKQSERLQEQQKKSQLLHALLQEGLKKKEEEIARLQEELERQTKEGNIQKDLAEELTAANENRAILAQEAMKQSPAYNKVQLIMADYRWKEETDHRMTEADWQELFDGMDACYGKVLSRLTATYQLDEREQRICCLLLMDVPVVHIAHLIGYTRPVIYKTEQKILQKMGHEYEKGRLRKLLKTM